MNVMLFKLVLRQLLESSKEKRLSCPTIRVVIAQSLKTRIPIFLHQKRTVVASKCASSIAAIGREVDTINGFLDPLSPY